MKLRSAGLILAALSSVVMFGCGKANSTGGARTKPPAAVSGGPYEGSGPNLLKNGDFEQADGSDATLPADWQRLQSTAETVLLVERGTDPSTGRAVEIRAHPEGKYWQVLTQDLPLPDSATTYFVSFDGSVMTTGRGRVALYLKKKGDKFERLGARDFDNEEWETHSFVARVPSEGAEGLELRLSHGDYKQVGSVVRFDNVSVQRAVTVQ